MRKRPVILGIGGTLRVSSTSERAIELCLAEAAKYGAETILIRGSELVLPPFDPSSIDRSANAKRLVELIRRSDGLIIGSPGYHGSISGLIKNALDYVEDLRDEKRAYLEGRAVGCIACAEGAQSIGSTLAALRSVVHALRGWPTPLGVGVNSSEKPFNADGDCADEKVRQQLSALAGQVVSFADAFGEHKILTDHIRKSA